MTSPVHFSIDLGFNFQPTMILKLRWEEEHARWKVFYLLCPYLMYPTGKEPIESVCKIWRWLDEPSGCQSDFFSQLLEPGSDCFKLPNGARSDISRVSAPLRASMCRSVTKLLPKRVGSKLKVSFYTMNTFWKRGKSNQFPIKLLLLQHLCLPL